MDQQTYLKKFSRAARWYLPWKESSAVTSDYRAMLAERTASGGDLVAELGRPAQAARLLREKGAYARWLAAFALMALCLLMPEVWLLTARFPRPISWLAAPLVIGLATALLWFRRDLWGKGAIPRGLLPAGLALVAILAATLFLLWCLAQNPLALPLGHIGPAAGRVLTLAGAAAGILALWGLVQGRMTDPRWAVLYGFGLAVLMVCALAMAELTSMDAEPLPIWGRFLGRG
jgi:hypothetical protein